MKRTYYSSEERTMFMKEYKNRQESENISVSAFAREKGINEYTFSNFITMQGFLLNEAIIQIIRIPVLRIFRW